MIAKAYQYTFYRLYCYSAWANGKGDSNGFNAMIMIGLLVACNLFALLMCIESFLNINLLAVFGEYSKWDWQLILPAILYFSLHYFLLIYQRRYKEIIKKYSKESEEQRKQGTKWMWAYLVGTPVLFILSAYLA